MKVTLVGAGPGDPDLLTVRAARALAACDLVLHDALVDPRVLELAGTAARFYVGKRAGRPSISQEEISALMVRAARAGRRVVRLKCGDPFVFGRGGEEALALAAAGLEVEVVPGISSAIAGPGAFGIPVSHRGVASGFVVLSAEPAQSYVSVLQAGPHPSLTYVLMMALGRRAEIARTALAHGFSATLPAAIVLGAHSARGWAWRGTLGDLPQVELPEALGDLPGLIVLGEVVALPTQLVSVDGTPVTMDDGTTSVPKEDLREYA